MYDILFENKTEACVLFNERTRAYFTGFTSSFGCVVLTPNERYFLTDSRYSLAASTAVRGRFELIVTEGRKIHEELSRLFKSLNITRIGFEDDKLSYAEYTALKKAMPGVALKPAGEAVAALMAVKTEEEIAVIAESQRINEVALEAALKRYRPRDCERDLQAEYIYQVYKSGGEDLSFQPIIAFGANAAMPHHHSGERTLGKGEFILIDCGVRYKGYCSDMTRVFCPGEPTKQMLKLYEIVLAAQNFALAHIRAGITCHEADSFAREYITSQGFGAEFTHGSGHGVGVNIHELPSLSRDREAVLLENMVVTVEPGIYIEGVGGVRIEDMAVVKKDGVVNLTSFKKDYRI